jgi:hypothetical protein
MKLLLAILLPALSVAAILPDAIGPYHRTSTSRPALSDKGLWDEYGLKESESAAYESAEGRSNVTAYRLADSTASMAAFEWQRPAGSTPSKLAPMAVETADSVMLVHGNYLLSFTGTKPEAAEVAALTGALKNVDGTSLPTLPGYLPAQSLVPNSERYVLGPEALARFFPGLPPSVAAFRFGTEATIGVFKTGNTETRLAIFNYPNHLIAREREPEFAKVQGAVVKRTGPLVAVVLNPTDPDGVERLLSQVRYQAEVTRDEYVSTRRDNVANLVLNAFYLIGILLAFALVSGLTVGGLRAYRRRGRNGQAADAILTLDINR